MLSRTWGSLWPFPRGTARPTRGSVPAFVGMSSHSILLHGCSECDDADRLEDVHGRRRVKTHTSRVRLWLAF